MREIKDVKELRSIQLSILDDVIACCDTNNIHYSLCGGTLIGALRHKGYIPWDDDIDIYMLRKDYDKFLSLYNKEQEAKGSHFRLMSPEICQNYIYTFGKVVDTRTKMVEDEAPDFEIGVYVDIFAIDYAFDDIIARKKQFRIKGLLYKIRRCKISRTCFLHSKLAFYIYKLLPISLKHIERLQRDHVFLRKPTSTICDMHNAYLKPSCAFPLAAMQEYTDAEFEGRTCKIMAGYDTYLRHTYKGDYMQLPPESERIHHYFKAWWKK